MATKTADSFDQFATIRTQNLEGTDKVGYNLVINVKEVPQDFQLALMKHSFPTYEEAVKSRRQLMEKYQSASQLPGKAPSPSSKPTAATKSTESLKINVESVVAKSKTALSNSAHAAEKTTPTMPTTESSTGEGSSDSESDTMSDSSEYASSTNEAEVTTAPLDVLRSAAPKEKLGGKTAEGFHTRFGLSTPQSWNGHRAATNASTGPLNDETNSIANTVANGPAPPSTTSIPRSVAATNQSRKQLVDMIRYFKVYLENTDNQILEAVQRTSRAESRLAEAKLRQKRVQQYLKTLATISSHVPDTRLPESPAMPPRYGGRMDYGAVSGMLHMARGPAPPPLPTGSVTGKSLAHSVLPNPRHIEFPGQHPLAMPSGRGISRASYAQLRRGEMGLSGTSAHTVAVASSNFNGRVRKRPRDEVSMVSNNVHRRMNNDTVIVSGRAPHIRNNPGAGNHRTGSNFSFQHLQAPSYTHQMRSPHPAYSRGGGGRFVLGPNGHVFPPRGPGGGFSRGGLPPGMLHGDRRSLHHQNQQLQQNAHFQQRQKELQQQLIATAMRTRQQFSQRQYNMQQLRHLHRPILRPSGRSGDNGMVTASSKPENDSVDGSSLASAPPVAADPSAGSRTASNDKRGFVLKTAAVDRASAPRSAPPS